MSTPVPQLNGVIPALNDPSPAWVNEYNDLLAKLGAVVPWSAKAYGAVLNGVADDGPALRSAISACSAAGGGRVLHPGGVLAWSGVIDVPGGVDLVGVGVQKDLPVSTFKALSADAKLQFGTRGGPANRGGTSGGFLVDRNGLATNPFYCGACEGRRFQSIHVYDSSAATDAWTGILIEEAQNLTFDQVRVTDGSDGWVFDGGTGGHLMLACKTRSLRGWHHRYKATYTASALYLVPTAITWVAPICEAVVIGTTPGFVDHAAGTDITYLGRPTFAGGNATTATTLVKVSSDGTHASGALRIYDGVFTGAKAWTTAIHLDAGTSAFLFGLTVANGLAALWDLAGGVATMAESSILNTTAFATGAGAADNVLRSRPRIGSQVTRDLVTDTLLAALLVGDTVNRVKVAADGTMTWGPGNAVGDVTLYRRAADQLKSDDKILAALGIGVGNSVASTTVRTKTREMEIFDAAGVSLGYVDIKT